MRWLAQRGLRGRIRFSGRSAFSNPSPGSPTLDADDGDVRDLAEATLTRLGGQIESVIDWALSSNLTAESHRRLLDIREKVAAAGGDARNVSELRALEVLERLGAVAVVTRLAEGADAAELTKQARAVLRRFGPRGN